MKWLSKFRAPRTAACAFASSLLFGCAPSAPPDIACSNSENFRLSVITTPITERLIRGQSVHAHLASASVKGAIMESMEMMGSESRHGKADIQARNAHSIAVISGGGEFGAYGAGFWQSYLSNTDLTFDIVTGVSTGALQATAVFLRTQEDLDDLAASYRVESEKSLVVKRRGFFGLARKSSAYSLQPARDRFTHYLTDERLEAVAAAAAKGRKLLIGAVDVQDGQFYAFDLTALAASDRPQDEIRRCYVESVFASAAIPMVFPPVIIDGHQYFDGGVRAAAFLSSTAGAISAMEGEHDHAPEIDVYILFNSYLETSPREAQATGLLDALGRTREIVFNQIDRTSLQSIAELSTEFNVRWARVQPGMCRETRAQAPKEKVFNSPFMRCLVKEGQHAGNSTSPFDRIE